MITWLDITLICCLTVVIIVIILIQMRKKWSAPTTPLDIVVTDAEKSHLQRGDSSFDHNLEHPNRSRRSSDVFPQRKPYFTWSDYPSLVARAVENGWPGFSFVSKEANVEISWEVFDESPDFMQKVRLNSELKESFSVIQAALPLPGPQFANASFPREAYFEIRVLPDDQEASKLVEDEEKDKPRIEASKLVEDDHLTVENSLMTSNKNEELGFEGKEEECEDEMSLVALGLSIGLGSNSLPLKIPGSFFGSIGFNSNGSVYLDGRKLVGESGKKRWGRTGNVIGCGYNPPKRRVFFTVNSQLVYEIRCKTEEFSHPLFPMLAANSDATVVVNLGQSPFKYEAANSQRTGNPCFVMSNRDMNCTSTAPYYELDSKELFSMGRIDGKWNQQHGRGAARSRSCSCENAVTADDMSEADLFEIVAR